METDDQTKQSSNPTLPTLTALDKTQDNFESLLLLLLQAYTTQRYPDNPSILGGAPISGEALDTLSPEQITALITSNSVNYEVIQQILAQQKGRVGRLGSPLHDQNNTLTLNPLAAEEVQQVDSRKSPTPLRSPASGGTNPQLIQITPQQLQVLQSQVNELLQSQHITLPADLSPEQQQQLIQTLLLRQLQVQQVGGAISVKDASMSMNQLLMSAGKQPQPVPKDTATAVADGSKGEEAGETSGPLSGNEVTEKKTATEAQSKKVRTVCVCVCVGGGGGGGGVLSSKHDRGPI